MADTVPAGFVLVDKPAGPSSHSAVQHVRRALGIGGRRGTKAGHAGTLDPFASGLLVVLIGSATRLMPYVVGHDKRYEMTVTFGASSDTDDCTGTLTHSDAPRPGRAAVEHALTQLAATTEQIPPAVSAIHIDGERAYRRVRNGEQIDVPARPVRFDAIELRAWDGEHAVIDVRCATGTYMRALARDIGELAGCPAHCSHLRRLEVGEWSVAGAPAPADVRPADIRDSGALVPELPRVQLADDAQVADVALGRRVGWDKAGSADAERVALVTPAGELAAIAEPQEGAVLQPRVVLVQGSSL